MGRQSIPIGTRVRVKNPDDFLSDKARKVRDRVGTVKSLTYPNGYPVVIFEAIGRRKEFIDRFEFRDLEIVDEPAP